MRYISNWHFFFRLYVKMEIKKSFIRYKTQSIPLVLLNQFFSLYLSPYLSIEKKKSNYKYDIRTLFV